MKKWIVGILGLAMFPAIFGLPPFSGGPTPEFAEGRTDFKSEVKRLPNGVYEVSALTKMPGVSPDMVRWWFADYMETTEHYKRWHPTAHIWMDWENKSPGIFIGASHLVHEYIGDELAKLRIQFVPAEEILGPFDLGVGNVAICAKAGLLDKPLYGGKMCHIVRQSPDGSEMLSRFWLGIVGKRKGNQQVVSLEGMLGNTYLARKLGVNEEQADALMQHAEAEMSYLADFLPGLYEEAN